MFFKRESSICVYNKHLPLVLSAHNMLMFALLHKQQQSLNFPVVPDCFLLPAFIHIIHL